MKNKHRQTSGTSKAKKKSAHGLEMQKRLPLIRATIFKTAIIRAFLTLNPGEKETSAEGRHHFY